MIDLRKYFETANEININVSDFLLSRFGPVKEITHKSDSHYGVVEDKESNKMYEDFLRIRTPEVALYTEEGERNLDNGLVWVIDPIEGTSNYRSGNPFWASQIALLYNNEPVVAIVNAPFLKQKFWAIKNKGAFLNENKIQVGDLDTLEKALIDMGRGTTDADKDWFTESLRKVAKKVRTTRSFGSTGLCISYAAAGITDIYMNSGSQIYDYAPGSLIAEEAGADVLNFKGDKWLIEDRGIVIGNENLTKQLLSVVK